MKERGPELPMQRQRELLHRELRPKKAKAHRSYASAVVAFKMTSTAQVIVAVLT